MHSLKGKVFLLIYLIVVFVNLLGHGLSLPLLELTSKPFLMPLLAFLVLVNVSGNQYSLKWYLIGALFFSWVGDMALLFDKQYPFLFMVGLGGFLIAHIHFIILFLKSAGKLDVTKFGVLLIVTVIILYTGFLIKLLWPFLNDLKVPVFVYSLVLMLMGVSAAVRFQVKGRVLVIIGALFFVASDSILALNKFYAPVQYGRVLTMLTYTLAQLIIVLGMLKTLKNGMGMN